MGCDWQRLEREALRVHARYQLEVVEALNLCPWAKDARSGGRVAARVSFMDRPDARACLPLLDALMARMELEVGFLIFPLLGLDRVPFSHFAADVRAAEAARRARGEHVFAVADFHPNASADATTPERLVPFLRRSPDPLLQIVRVSALERVRARDDHGTSFLDPQKLDMANLLGAKAPAPPVAERVARHNAQTLDRLGPATFEVRIRNILDDRHASYAGLGLPPPAWAGTLAR